MWRFALLTLAVLAAPAAAQVDLQQDPFADIWRVLNLDEPAAATPERSAGPATPEATFDAPVAAAPSPTNYVFGARAEVRFQLTSRAPTSAAAPVFRPDDSLAVVVDVQGQRPGAPLSFVWVGVEGGRYQRAVCRSGSTGAYVLDTSVAGLLGPSSGPSEDAYTVFRTTGSQDALTVRGLLQGNRTARTLPRVERGFFDEGGPEGLGPELGRLSGAELFEAGGLRQVAVKVLSPEGGQLATAMLPVAGQADWMYFSGHYPYTSGGLINGEDIDPVSITGRGWRQHLDVLVFASCYAVDINAPGAEVIQHGRGIHGARWWQKFGGTLLGYRGLAPSHPTDSEISRRFLARVARSPVDPTDKSAYSRMVSEAWMHVNMHEMGQMAASAIDADGRFYYLRSSEVNLRGVPVRGSYRWAIADRSVWQAQNDALQSEYALDQQVFAPIRAMQWGQYGGRPPSRAQVEADPAYQAAVLSAGLDPASSAMQRKLDAFLEYETHIFFDVPRPDYYQRALTWLVTRRGPGATPPSLDEVDAHFTPPGARPKALRPPREVLAGMLFQEYAWQAMSQWGLSAEAVAARMALHFPVDESRRELLRYLERYLAGPEAPGATD